MLRLSSAMTLASLGTAEPPTHPSAPAPALAAPPTIPNAHNDEQVAAEPEAQAEEEEEEAIQNLRRRKIRSDGLPSPALLATPGSGSGLGSAQSSPHTHARHMKHSVGRGAERESKDAASPRVFIPRSVMQWLSPRAEFNRYHGPGSNNTDHSSEMSESTFGMRFSQKEISDHASEIESDNELIRMNSNEQAQVAGAKIESRRSWANGWTLILFVIVSSLMVAAVIAITVWTSIQDGLWARILVLFHLPLFCVVLWHIVKRICESSSGSLDISTPSTLFSDQLPRFTVILPVYTEEVDEDLKEVVRKLKAAILLYKLRGGGASLLVCDDGLHKVSEAEKTARINFYTTESVPFIARPADETSDSREPRIRGVYSKAAGLNYCLNIAHKVCKKLRTSEKLSSHLTSKDAMHQVWSSAHYNSEFLTGGSIVLNELIMVVDLRTDIPAECLIEMSRVFLSNASISYAVPQTTTVAPIRGLMSRVRGSIDSHFRQSQWDSETGGTEVQLGNTHMFIRWKALKEAAYPSPAGEDELYFWAPSLIFHDMELSLRLQTLGFSGKIAASHQYNHTSRSALDSTTLPALALTLSVGASQIVFQNLTCCGRLLRSSFLNYLFSKRVSWYGKINTLVTTTFPLCVLVSLASLFASLLYSVIIIGGGVQSSTPFTPLTFAGSCVILLFFVGLFYSTIKPNVADPSWSFFDLSRAVVMLILAVGLPFHVAGGCILQLVQSSQASVGVVYSSIHWWRSVTSIFMLNFLLLGMLAILYVFESISINWIVCAGCVGSLALCSSVIVLFLELPFVRSS